MSSPVYLTSPDDTVSPVSPSLTVYSDEPLNTEEGEHEVPENDIIDADSALSQKKKKKKKPKKSASAKLKEAAAKAKAAEASEAEGRPPVLCISRNKHWRYISSYHGPWLQLPLELLESLLSLNLDPATLSPSELRTPEPYPAPAKPTITNTSSPAVKLRDRGFQSLGSDFLPPDSPGGRFIGSNAQSITPTPLPAHLPLPLPKPGKAPPPPIDPGVFRNVTSIRRLIDEAAELSVRASSGLSAAELGSMRGNSPGAMGGMGGIALNGSPWAAAQTLGINPLGTGSGRNVAMSAMRIHRLRALAVQKLAQAYKADEIASSVMVMQGGSVFDDVAEKVLKNDPNDADAKYVHFFHEKIPSRQLAESTTTQVLDELIQIHPQRLEYYRTRGIVHCFRDEYLQATKDFTYALKEARAARKAKMASHNHAEHGSGGGKNSFRGQTKGGKSGKKRKGGKGSGGGKINGQAPPSGTSATATEDWDEEREGGEVTDNDPSPLLHPSVLPDAPDPIEPQLLFLRGAAYLQHAIYLIEQAVLDLEGIGNNNRNNNTNGGSNNKPKTPYPLPASLDAPELRLCYLEDSRYGGVEIGNPAGPLGPNDGPKVKAYRAVLAADNFQEQIASLIKKSIRDHERFLAHFDTLEADLKGKGGMGREDLKAQTEYAFTLSESIRPGSSYMTPGASSPTSPFGERQLPPPATMFTTYHPLLVESHFSILLSMLMLGDFVGILPAFIRTAALVDGLEGYPVFLPPRSMSQAEFVEVLERLAGGWKKGFMEDVLAMVPASAGRRGGGGGGSGGLYSPSPSSSLISSSNGSSVAGSASASGSLSSGSSSPATTTTDLNDELSPVPEDRDNERVDMNEKAGSGSGSGSSSKAGSGSGSGSGSNATPQTSSPTASASASASSSLHRSDAVEALDSLRILLAPVIERQRVRAEMAAAEKEREKAHARALIAKNTGKGLPNGTGNVGGSGAMKKKPISINIPLHGPRVEVVLAWLGAVHLPELDDV